jgi:hypothetical protein
MTQYERVNRTVPGLLMKVRGSVLIGDLDSAAVTLLTSIIPLLCGLAQDSRVAEAPGREALAELSLVLRRPFFSWRAEREETLEASQRVPKSISVNLKALDFAIARLEDATPPTDAEIVTLIKACSAILEVQTMVVPEKLRLVK